AARRRHIREGGRRGPMAGAPRSYGGRARNRSPRAHVAHADDIASPHDGGDGQGRQTTSGSLKASGSSSAEPTGMQLQKTFLSPCTLSTRATGGQYFCWRRLGSGNAASSRG